MFKKIKAKLKKFFFIIKENIIDLLFALGFILIHIALFNIHINLGLISMGLSFIYFAVILQFHKKKINK